LERITNNILSCGGIIDKYFGDSIIAYWLEKKNKNHAELACECALKCLNDIKKIKINEIEIGIGINTGNFFLGNRGSEHKIDYSIIGETVNTASRLVNLGKQFNKKVLITESTRKEIGEKFNCDEAFTTKSKENTPLSIFEIVNKE
jgi:adenylate cyclase